MSPTSAKPPSKHPSQSPADPDTIPVKSEAKPELSGTAGGREETLIGRCLDGKFVLRELIGKGSCGAVYRGDQVALNRTVAVKVLRSAGDAALAQRFQDEAFAISRVHHPNVVSIYDHGCTSDGLLYIVMEHLRGRTLRAVLAAEHPLAESRITGIVIQVLDALEEAHAAGVIHADLKSDNIFIEELRDRRDLVKVIDFGIARLVHDRAAQSEPAAEVAAAGTSSWRVTGTPEYMAPEVILGQAPARTADMYAVGVLLYEMVSGTAPFTGETIGEILSQHVQDEAEPLSTRVPELSVDPEIEGIIARALAKETRLRFADATSMREALQRVQAEHRDVAVCQVCGTRYGATFRFCAECGARLAIEAGSAGQARRAVEREKVRGERAFDGGNSEEAVDIMRGAVGMAIRLGNLELIVDCYHSLATLLVRTGVRDAAISELEEAINLVTAGEDSTSAHGPDELWRLLVLLAELYYETGRHRDALSVGSRALLAARQASSGLGRQAAQALMTRLYAEARKGSERPVERLLERDELADPANALFSISSPGESPDSPVISQDDTAPWVLLEDLDRDLE